MVRRTQDHPHRHIRQERLQPRLLGLQLQRLARDGLGQRAAGFRQALRGGLGSGGKVTQVTGDLCIHRRGHIGMRPRAQGARQHLDRLGDVQVEKDTRPPPPAPARQNRPAPRPARNPAPPPDRPAANSPAKARPPLPQSRPPQGPRRSERPAAEGKGGSASCHTGAVKSLRTSSRRSFSSNGFEMKPSAPSASPFRRSIAEPRAVIISTFTSAREGSIRMPSQIS
jgi:hypothetical protein